MVVSLQDLLEGLKGANKPGDTSASEALWVRFGSNKTHKTVEYRTQNDEIVHVYLDQNDVLVGIEIFS